MTAGPDVRARRPGTRGATAAARRRALLRLRVALAAGGLCLVALGVVALWLVTRVPPEAPPPGPGPVAFLVTDPAGSPLAGARLRFYRDLKGPLDTLPPPLLGEASSGADGRAVHVLPGPCHVIVEASGSGATPDFCGPGDAELRVMVGPPERQTGTVVDSRGRPVAGADVLAYYGTPLAPVLDATTTDASGGFELARIPGRLNYFFCRVRAKGFALAEAEARPGQPTVVKLHDSAPVTGRVLDSSRRPLAEALVIVRSLRTLWTRTDADGKFRLEHVVTPKGGVELLVEHGDLVHHPVRELEPGEDREVMLYRPGRVRGIVRDARTARSLAECTVSHKSGPRAYTATTTDSHGRFELGGMPAGGVELLAVRPVGAASARIQVEIREGGLLEGAVITL